jgi:hypothetical protein
MGIYLKYGIITVLMALLFNASSVGAGPIRTYKCGTVYVSNNEGERWSEYRESQIKLYMELDYPRMAMEDNEGDQYFYTFESYKKTYYKRDGKRLKKLIMKGLNTYTGDKVVVTVYEYDTYWSVLEIVENNNVKILFKIHQNIN